MTLAHMGDGTRTLRRARTRPGEIVSSVNITTVLRLVLLHLLTKAHSISTPLITFLFFRYSV